MVLSVDLFQSLARDMRVDLGRREVRVAEQHLHDPQVRTVIQQMCREGVPQGVR